MTAIVIIIALVALMLSLNALYVAAEFATVTAHRTRISHLAETGHLGAKRLLFIIEDRQTLNDYISACQIGITIASLVLGAYGQNKIVLLLSDYLGEEEITSPLAAVLSVVIVLLILIVLHVVGGELIPKSVALEHPERTALFTVFPVYFSLRLFRPLIWLFSRSSQFILKLINADRSAGLYQVRSPEEIELLMTESHEGGLLDDTEQQMLRNAFRLRELLARQVMVPRTRMIAAPAESTIDELLAVACEAGFTRLPLYKNNIDNIIGFVHIKDLFRFSLKKQQTPEEIWRRVVYVPEDLPIVDVWTTLNTQRQYIAIVVDEYGGTAGLITFEDLIEEIFGELQDEFDDEQPLISSDKEGHLSLRADLLVTDVNEYLELTLPDEADTLGGLIFSQLGHLPEVGDTVTVGDEGVTLQVKAMENRFISEVLLHLPSGIVPHVNEWEMNSDE